MENETSGPTLAQHAGENPAEVHQIEIKTPPQEDSTSFKRQSGLKHLGPFQPITLEYQNLCLDVVDKNNAPKKKCCQRAPKNTRKKRILHSATGLVKPGELVAVMGASGAGKSTLLNVLANRVEPSEGSLLVNNQKADRTYRRISAYVQQDDLFYGTLTPREHLQYQAKLRLDKSFSDEKRREMVDTLISVLGLTKCQNTLIGNVAQGGGRGISGGERKRLSFAAEVLTNPALLFADEPTSGLDSFMAQGVVEMMQDLAHTYGRTVVSTIHQPSSEIFELFDRLILLAHGEVVYDGKRASAVEWFASLGYNCPQYTNPSDYFLRVLSKEPGDAALQRIIDAWKARNTVLPYGYDEDYLNGTIFGPEASIQETEPVTVGPRFSGRKYNNSFCREFSILLGRSIKTMVRDPMLTKARAGQTIVLSLIAGLIYLRLDNDQESFQNKSGAIFFILTNQCFSGVFGVLNVFPLERPIFLRETESRAYRLSSFFLAKTVSDFPFQIVFPAIFVSITWWMIGLRDDFPRFLGFIGIILLASNAAISLGYLISGAAPSVQFALAIGPVALLPFLIFGGLFVNIDSIPAYFKWLEYISFFKYGYSSGSVLVWDGQRLDCPPAPQPCRFATGEEVLDFISISPDDVLRDVLVLVAMIVVYRVLAWLALEAISRKRQNA